MPDILTKVFDSKRSLAVAVVTEIEREAKSAIDSRGAFHLVLAGGSTPGAVYERLATRSHHWPSWNFYFGDERCAPAGDELRNDTMARASLLDKIEVPDHCVFSIPAEHGPVVGAVEYSNSLKRVGYFDLVLLGLGEDGHTASLFPGNYWGEDSDCDSALPVTNSPKPPSDRVSMSVGRLSCSRR
ncbi:MAG: 6-phosphogluconolactonase, partial [Pseudomonadota bacterium]